MQFDRTNPVGTWQGRVTPKSQASTVEDRQLKERATEGLVIFEPDHTLLSLAPSPGAGTWQADSPNSISFGFTEVSYYQADGTFTGYALVTQQGDLSEDGTTFSSSGYKGACSTFLLITMSHFFSYFLNRRQIWGKMPPILLVSFVSQVVRVQMRPSCFGRHFYGRCRLARV